MCKVVYVFFLFVLNVSQASAGGGWTRDSGSVYLKLGATSLTTTSYHGFDGRSMSVNGISTQTIHSYAEFGVDSRTMIVLDAPLFKTSSMENAGSASGITDMGIGFMYGVQKGNWPIALGILLELPLGSPDNFVANSSGELFNLPTGDGELNAWLRGAVSHSFWPAPYYATFEAGYNFRSIAVREFTQRYDGGKLTNNYYVQAEFGYQPLEQLCLIARLKSFGPTLTPTLGRYSFFGLGEGVQYVAYYITAVYNVTEALSINADFSSAFSARAIFGGANLMAGISYTWR
ncbi:MAG: hypothetical protein HQ472_10035 [Ignavibacteria bacterium]|nr:hypothetical protein [Ignavibacteria bacterium]